MQSDRSSGKPTRDDEVGYGKPPAAKRFPPGRSGNPSGRPKKQKSAVEWLDLELSRLVLVKEKGKNRKMPLRRVVMRNLLKAMVEGDLPAIKLIILSILSHHPAPTISNA